MANLKIVPGTTKTLFTGTVTICGKTGRIELQKAEFQDQQGKKVELFAICIPNFCAIPLGPSLEVEFDFLRGIGLKLGSKPKNQQGKLIFQAETDFPNLPQRQAIGVKIYKTANNDYECVLSKLFNESSQTINGSPITISYSASVASATLEGIFEAIEKLKVRIATALSSNSFYTDNPYF
ncbi:hypothetical protein HMPREF1988_00649 [Porphyromonas gingivalis F0185]|uniref:hypothetical protein n=1 Tax=Porphyromonas gingivalis TaxID=837 RepID=UPI0003AD2559|nr:hypothetical protein [Porphyromonas gingivalis]ERJ84641.1 hypothetical protein HMPREF1988_00649 [Porphyromonas gingivalis F0185]